jgi:D-ribose pyranose/furanose isomerase RbsD
MARAVDMLVQFPDLAGVKNLLPAMYTIRQIIAQEINIESMRLEEQMAARRIGHHSDLTKSVSASQEAVKEKVVTLKVVKIEEEKLVCWAIVCVSHEPDSKRFLWSADRLPGRR